MSTMRQRRRDSGYSLVELLVAISIFSVIGTMLTAVVISTLRTSTGTRARLADVDNIRVAMDSMTKTLRTAIAPSQLGAVCSPTACTAPFQTLKPCKVVFWANLGTSNTSSVDRPARLTYQFEVAPGNLSADLVEIRQAPDGASGIASAWNTTPVRRVLLENIVWDASRFGSGDGCSTGSPTAPIFRFYTNTDAATTDPTTVYAIGIALPVRTESALHAATTSEYTKVFLPNTAWGR